MDGISTVKLVRKSAFKGDAFESVDSEALKVIESAEEHQILALTITRNSPLKIAKAEIFDRAVFEKILSSK